MQPVHAILILLLYVNFPSQAQQKTDLLESHETVFNQEVPMQNVWDFAVSSIAVLIIFLSINAQRQQRRKHQKEAKMFKIDTEKKLNEQRLEISRELHDSMGAQLTFISSILEGLKSSPGIFDEGVNTKIHRLSEFSDNTINELKNTLWVLNSREINLEDLRAKILNFIKSASEAKENLRFNFQFEVSENYSLNSKPAVNLFRAVQEIVNNAIKYARASEIKIEVQHMGRTLTIKIADNGDGFDYEKEKNKSFGLKNIQSRIAEIDGTVRLKTAVGKGTDYSIQVEL